MEKNMDNEMENGVICLATWCFIIENQIERKMAKHGKYLGKWIGI